VASKELKIENDEM